MDKKTYYVSVANGEISQVKTANTYSFMIEATDEEILRIREYFDNAYREDLGTFLRSHVPFIEYDYDSNNDRYDEQLQEAYRMIYELGDHEAKELIAQMGIINGL
ncbi:hydrolase [Bacillus pseudomycoides]|nr:hydrolase [Bacillus pseudomycoides]